MRAYVQSVPPGTANYQSTMQVDYWFWERGYEVIRFTLEEMAAGKLDDDLMNDIENTIVFGGVGTIRQAISRIGRLPPPNLDFPDSIRQFAGRRIWESNMSEVRKLVNENSDALPIHIKPRDHHKLFKGVLVRGFRDLIPSASVAGQEPVLAQEAVDFRSEWRATIFRRAIINVAHYKGDPLLFPNVQTMRSALDLYTDCPIGFAMDWGITSTGETLLVEVNDGFSLGNYGLRGHEYTALIEARWRELMGLSDNGVGVMP